jgi:hypothetical protein
VWLKRTSGLGEAERAVCQEAWYTQHDIKARVALEWATGQQVVAQALSMQLMIAAEQLRLVLDEG